MELSREQGLDYLLRWKRAGATLWLNFAAHDATAASTMLAQITEISVCLVFKNPSSNLRFSLHNATFSYGPLQALLTPSRLGTMAVISQKPQGLVRGEGLHIRLESGHLLFVSDHEPAEEHGFESSIRRWTDDDLGGALESSGASPKANLTLDYHPLPAQALA